MAVACLLALAACGSARTPSSSTSLGTDGSTQTSSGTPSTTAPGSLPPQTTPSGVTPRATQTPTMSPGGSARALTVALDLTCARPGVDSQGLTVHGADKAGPVGYSTEYSDHSNELTNRTYQSGYGYGKADSNGDYRTTWTVPATAPAGKAVVHVIVSGDPSRKPVQVSYVVAGAGGRC